jgi:hypothetical protein
MAAPKKKKVVKTQKSLTEKGYTTIVVNKELLAEIKFLCEEYEFKSTSEFIRYCVGQLKEN